MYLGEKDYFVFVGDRTNVAEFNAGSIITVQGAYSDGLSPETTNNGSWTVDRTFYNGAGNEEVLASNAVNDTFTVAGNYADKFVPGFEFTVNYEDPDYTPPPVGSPLPYGNIPGGSPAPTYIDNYVVRETGSPNIGATYDSVTDTTTIPVTTNISESFGSPNAPGGSPSPDAAIYFDGTDQTFVYVTPEIVTDTYPYGRVNLSTGTSNARASAYITDSIMIGWNVVDWFQYPILSVDLIDNTITVAGDARADMQIGQEFELLADAGSPNNNGIYTVRIDEDYRTYGSPVSIRSEVEYDGNNTTIAVHPNLVAASLPNIGSPLSFTINGYIEPNNDAAAIIAFADTIGVTGTETTDGAVLQTGGPIMGAFDYPYWDVGGFDENTGTVIHLYSGTFE